LVYTELAGDRWAALAVPRTAAGQPLPTLFWQEGVEPAPDRDDVRGQALLPLMTADAQDAPLLTGAAQGVIEENAQGRLLILLVERTTFGSPLKVYALSAAPGGFFQQSWRSHDEPLWPARSPGMQVELVPLAEDSLPALVLTAPLAAESPLRQALEAPALFVEQPP